MKKLFKRILLLLLILIAADLADLFTGFLHLDRTGLVFCWLLTIEILGWGILGLWDSFATSGTEKENPKKIFFKRLVPSLFLMSYLATWILGSWNVKKNFEDFVHKECPTKVMKIFDKDVQYPVYSAQTLPVFPFLVISFQSYQFAPLWGEGDVRLYFWNGFNVKEVWNRMLWIS